MTTILSEGVIVPDVGDVNWAGKLEVNWNLLNGALANLSGNVKLDRDNTWTGEQSFTLPIVGSITGTASKAIADEDGTSIKSGYVNVAGNQTVSGNKEFTGSNTFNNILPNATNTYSLGSSSYQWSSVYAQSYYYNGTEFQNKFVTLDTNQTITGYKRFKRPSFSSDNTVDITQTSYESAINVGYVEFVDNAVKWWGDIEVRVLPDASSQMIFYLSNWKANGTQGVTGMTLNYSKDFSTVSFTAGNNVADLGTSANKWKSLNGINPGALSLPDSSKAINIDTTDWVYDGFTSNSWTATVDCWVTVYSLTTRILILRNTTLNIGSVSERTGSFTNYVYVPVRKDDVVTLIAGGTSDVTVIAYPCLGNV